MLKLLAMAWTASMIAQSQGCRLQSKLDLQPFATDADVEIEKMHLTMVSS